MWPWGTGRENGACPSWRSIGGKRILVDTGASDLFQKNMERLGLALELTQAGTAFLCTGHCTKQRAYDILQQELGDRLHQLQVGLVMEF